MRDNAQLDNYDWLSLPSLNLVDDWNIATVERIFTPEFSQSLGYQGVSYGTDTDDPFILDRAPQPVGDDVYFLGQGSDFFLSGSNSDLLIFAGDGRDTVLLGGGDDVVFLGRGNDFADLYSGNDIAIGGSGRDTALGGAGNDVLVGGAGADKLQGETGNDHLVSGDLVETNYSERENTDFKDNVIDTLDGGADDDTLVASYGTNTELTGGSGEDSFVIELVQDEAKQEFAEHRITDYEDGDTIVFKIDLDDSISGSPQGNALVDFLYERIDQRDEPPSDGGNLNFDYMGQRVVFEDVQDVDLINFDFEFV